MHGFALFIALFAPGIAAAADPLPPGAVLRLGETKFRAGGEIRHLRFSPDGTVLLGWVVGLDARLHPIAWEAATGVVVSSSGTRAPPDDPERTTAAASLSGDRIVTAGPGCVGRVWDAKSRRQLALLLGHSAPVTAVAVSNDGKIIATGSADGLIKLWDAETFHPLTLLSGHTSTVRTIRVSTNGMRAVTSGDDQSARVWDLKTGKELRGFLAKGPAEFTPDGTALVMSERDGMVVRDVLTGLEVVPTQPPAHPTCTISELLSQIGLSVAFSPDGRMVAWAHRNGTIGLYEITTGQQRRMLVGHRSYCCALTFTPDGSRLLTAGADHSVLVWAVRIRDVAMPETVWRETRAGKLWVTMTTGRADVAYLAMARFAAEPLAAVRIVRLRLQPADSAEGNPEDRLADARGIELLESLGTIAARELLEELATGEPSAYRTREAKRALGRIGGGAVSEEIKGLK